MTRKGRWIRKDIRSHGDSPPDGVACPSTMVHAQAIRCRKPSPQCPSLQAEAAAETSTSHSSGISTFRFHWLTLAAQNLTRMLHPTHRLDLTTLARCFRPGLAETAPALLPSGCVEPGRSTCRASKDPATPPASIPGLYFDSFASSRALDAALDTTLVAARVAMAPTA